MNTRAKILKSTVSLFILCFVHWSGQLHQAQLSSKSTPSSPRLIALMKQLQEGDRSALVHFWEEIRKEGTPLVEPIADDKEQLLVTFLWQGKSGTRNVVVFLQTGGLTPADN
jgi:hypothetical protein